MRRNRSIRTARRSPATAGAAKPRNSPALRLRKRGFAAFDGGLEKSYRRARKALREAYSEPSDETFHALRKSVQWHWRQMSLLGACVARGIRGPCQRGARAVADAGRRSRSGDADRCDGQSRRTSRRTHKEAIVGLCIRKQQALRAAVEHPAEQLFAEPAGAFVERMQAYWKHGRRAPVLDSQPIARQSTLQFQTALTRVRSSRPSRRRLQNQDCRKGRDGKVVAVAQLIRYTRVTDFKKR